MRPSGLVTRGGKNGAIRIKGKYVLLGTRLRDAQDSTTDPLFYNRSLAKLISYKTWDSILVRRATRLEKIVQ